MSRPEFQHTVGVTIANGESLSSSSGDLAGWRVGAIIPDAQWDTNAVTFQASHDGTVFHNLFDEATEYSIAGVTSLTWRTLDPAVILTPRYLRVRSGTAAAAVNQVGATVITLVLVPA
jgi:hypothetical protein